MGKIKISDLSCEHVMSEVSRVDDWKNEFGSSDDGDERGRFVEAVRCEACNTPVVVSGSGDERHCDLDTDSECEGVVTGAEGPMMNYFYPCNLRDLDAAAIAIVDLPLCVVVRANGDIGFALTGGGMDLSWEICDAYVLCGYLPPVERADNLPIYTMHGNAKARAERVLSAARASARFMTTRAKAMSARIREMPARIAESEARKGIRDSRQRTARKGGK